MTPPVFRFYLKSTPTSWYYIGSGGGLEESASPRPILYAPVGWDDVKLAWGRSERRWGVLRSFTTPLGFIKDAARILRHLFAAYGVESICLLSIEKLQTYSLTYAPFYEGEIDFSNHTDTDTQVQENVMEGGLSEMLRKKDNIPYEIDISGADVISINNDGIVLGQFEILSISLPNAPASASLWAPEIQRSFAENPLGVDTREISQRSDIMANLLPAKWFFKATTKGTVRIKIKMEILCGNPVTSLGAFLSVRVAKVKPDQTDPSDQYNFYEYGEPFGGFTHHVDQTLEFLVDAGDQLTLLVGVSGYVAGDPPQFTWLYGSSREVEWTVLAGTLEIQYPRRNSPYTVESLPYYKVFEKLIDALTGGQFSGNSAFLSDTNMVSVGNRPAFTMVTSGDAIRGLPDAKLKITLAELLQDAWSRWGLTIGIVGDVARLEPLSFFFPNTFIAHLGAPADVKMRPATELMGNSLKIGYKDQNYGDIYGKDEFNAGQVYSLSVSRVQKELDFTSPWRADMYGIETLSRNLEGKERQDSASDNDTFLIEVAYFSSGGFHYWGPYRPNNAANTSGLVSPDSAYNLMLSPARSLKRIGYILRSLHDPASGNVVFQTADKNADVFTNIPGEGPVFGKGDAPLPSYGPLFCKPYWMEFESSIPDGTLAAIQNTPNGYFTFEWRGSTWMGFCWNLEIKPALHEKQTVKLLAHPATNLLLSVL